MQTPEQRLDYLNSRVTSAILHAEHLSLGRERQAAYWEVANLEEEIAMICPAGTVEGDVARHGAITASIEANELVRAYALANRYLSETPSAPGLEELKDEILRKVYGDSR